MLRRNKKLCVLLHTGHTDVLKMTSQYCDSGFRPEGVKEEGLSVFRLCDTEIRLPLLRPTLDNPAVTSQSLSGLQTPP